MKNIKTILLVTISTFAITCVQAQDVKREIAKPVESTVPPPGSTPMLAPDTKPSPDLTRSKKQQEQPALKESTEKPVLVKEKEEAIKPQLVPAQNLITTPVLITESRKDAVNRVPVLPAPSANFIPVPAPTPTKKMLVVEQQQN